MDKPSYINPKFDLQLEKPKNVNLVSYSQFSQFSKCPLSWKLSYIDKLRKKEASIHTVFGDAMHAVIQKWTITMYTESIKASEKLDLRSMLLTEMKSGYAKAVAGNGDNFATKEELTEFYMDGADTLVWLRKNRKRYFDPRTESLIGIELPLVINLNGVYFVAYLDFVIQDKVSKKIKIIDFKTSTSGWNDWAKSDDVKTSQLILYKIFFSKQFNVPIDDISVEYIILKRKTREDSDFPQRRVQQFIPSQGKITYNRVKKNFDSFISSCFLPDGSYNTLHDYRAISGYNDKNCKFCTYSDRYDLCPVENRKPM